jgi:hypothetical protein
VLLFDGHDGSKSDECGVNIDNVLFDDQATTAVNADYLSPFKDISIRPLDRLDRYNGLQVIFAVLLFYWFSGFSVCRCLSMFVDVCRCVSMFVDVCRCVSMFVDVCR